MGDRLGTPGAVGFSPLSFSTLSIFFIFLQPLPAPLSITEHETIAQRLLTNGPKRSKAIATAGR